LGSHVASNKSSSKRQRLVFLFGQEARILAMVRGQVGMDRTTLLFGKVQMFVLLELAPPFGAKSADFY